MNAKHLSLLICLSSGMIHAAFAQRSVTIPAQSSSSLNGSEDNQTAPPLPVVPLSTPFSGKSSVSRVSVPTSTPGTGTVTALTNRVSDPVPNSNVIAMQRVEPVKTQQDVATIKRLTVLRKELNVTESASKARISLPADELFVENSAADLDELSKPTLLKMTEYMELTLKKEVTVKAYFIPDDPKGEEQSWSRSLSLVKWITANSTIDPEKLKVLAPEPLSKKTPKEYSTTPGDSEFVTRIELNLE